MSDAAPVSREIDAPADDPDALAEQVRLLTAENRRLREEYRRVSRSRHRRAALGLAAVGLVATAAGFALETGTNVLLALGGTGLFAAVLVYYLTPDRPLPESATRGTYDAFAAVGEALVDELGLSATRVYVPVDDGRVRLYVPQSETYNLPAFDAGTLFVVPDDATGRGIAIRPTGAALFDELEHDLEEGLATDPGALAA